MNIYFLLLIMVMIRYFIKLGNSIETERLETELFELRLRLSSLVEDDKIKVTDLHFIFLNDCLDEAPDNLIKLSLIDLMYYAFKGRKETYCSYAELENQFAYNHELKSIFRGYTNASVAYFNARNRKTIFVFKVITNAVKAIASLFYKSGDKSFISDFKKSFKVLLLKRSSGLLNLG
jgi:hypothetical protein